MITAPKAVEAVAVATPDAIAVVAEDGNLTYRDLWRNACDVADRLIREGVRPGDAVAVHLPPSSHVIAVLLGIAVARAVYVPLDPAEDSSTLDRRAQLAGVRFTVDDQSIAVLLGEPGAGARVRGSGVVLAEDRAYVMFTSGTTSESRAVVVSHANLAFSTQARTQVYRELATFLLLSPLFFDSSVAGIWGTLVSGGTLVVPTEDQRRDPREIVALMHRRGVTRTLMIPSLYRAVLLSAKSSGALDALDALREVIVAGERLPGSLIDLHFELLPHVHLINEYGPTEATVWVAYRRYTHAGPSMIGTAIPGAEMFIVDAEGAPVPPGDSGEVVVGGPGVAEGYLGDPEATRRAFVRFEHLGPGTWYRTGDLGRRSESGELEFLGRRDRQVKVSGRRIELESVETALTNLPEVAEACAHASTDGSRLVAHIVVAEGSAADQARVRVRAINPKAHRPHEVHVHSALPRTPNGKVDTKALEESVRLSPTAPSPAHPGRTPGDDTEPLVAAAWTDVLGRSGISRTSNFFDAGGNSMLMIHLQRALAESTGHHVSVVSLFQHTTIASQAAMLSDIDSAAEPHSLPGRAARAQLVRARRHSQQRT